MSTTTINPAAQLTVAQALDLSAHDRHLARLDYDAGPAGRSTSRMDVIRQHYFEVCRSHESIMELNLMVQLGYDEGRATNCINRANMFRHRTGLPKLNIYLP